MILTNQLTVPADPDAVYRLLQEASRVVSCLPGATLLRSDGDTHEGRVRVKIGPVTADYEGVVRFLESDPDSRRLRLSAHGHDAKGNGDAEAAVHIAIDAADDGSSVRIETDLSIRGRLAQFGQSAIGPVSQRLMDQFEANIGRLVLTAPDEPGPAPPSTDPATRNERATAPSAAPAAAARVSTDAELDALSLFLDADTRRRAGLALVAVAGLIVGYAVGRAVTVERFYRRSSQRHPR